jgi:hypothetical protein
MQIIRLILIQNYSNLNMNANVMRKDNPITVTNNNKIDLNFRGRI